MRERLTAAFVAITLLLLIGAGLVRSYSIEGQLRQRESEFITAEARGIGGVLAAQQASGDPVDTGLLEPFVAPRLKIVFEPSSGKPLVLQGDDFKEADEAVSATVFIGDDELTILRPRTTRMDTLWGGDPRATLALLGLLGLVAGLIGYVVARNLSAPFRQLASAAAALGRGRFDLDLPQTRVPEARAIAMALESSASQLRDRLEREREFGLMASHVLRTPLTSLGFQLEELVGDPTLSPDARESARGCLKAVSRLNEVAGELVEISGRGVLIAGAAIPLRDLAGQIAQRWSDALEHDDRDLSAAVEGDIELLFTPGPIEQVLDMLLDDVVRHERGAVRLVFEGAASRLRIDITCAGPNDSLAAPSRPVQERALAVVAALGGRLEQRADGQRLRVHLPRR